MNFEICGVRPGSASALAFCPSLGIVRCSVADALSFCMRDESRLSGEHDMIRLFACLVAVVLMGIGGKQGLCAETTSEPNHGRRVYQVAIAATVIIVTDRGHGSGFIWQNKADGSRWLVTNQHVVEGVSELDVIHSRASGKAHVANAIVDAGRDLALLPVPAELRQFPGLEIAEIPPEIGDDVFALGTPKQETFSFTKGVVSAFRNHGGQRLIQTDVAVTHGSSGGPLLNGDGKLIGIVVSVPSIASSPIGCWRFTAKAVGCSATGG